MAYVSTEPERIIQDVRRQEGRQRWSQPAVVPTEQNSQPRASQNSYVFLWSGEWRGKSCRVAESEIQFATPAAASSLSRTLDVVPAQSHADVPKVAERLLRKVESISALMASDESPLPLDVTQVIFRALYLSTEAKKGVVYLLEDDTGVSITTMRKYIAQIFKTYEMMASALGPPVKPRGPPSAPSALPRR